MDRIIYQERLFSRVTTVILGAALAIVLGLMVRHWLTAQAAGPHYWVLLVMFVWLFFGILNTAYLKVAISDKGVSIRMGVLLRSVQWEDIVDCYPDEASAAWNSIGGVKLGSYKGKRRLACTTIGDSRVVLLRRGSSFPELVFSTRNPQEVIEKVRAGLKRTAR